MKLQINKKLDIVIAVAFAVSILVISYLLKGHPQSNTIVIVMIGLYFTVANLIRSNNSDCHSNTN